jgi:penicillin-binding protein 2
VTSLFPNDSARFEDLNIDPHAMDVVLGGMVQTMNFYYGTGYYASSTNNIHTIAGKTGSPQLFAERGQTKGNGLFVGFAPYNNPRYSICTSTENAQSPQEKAVFLASRMMKFIGE